MQDQDPKRFRTRGLRNLARNICRIVREYSTPSCAINATGGYKAQFAIAVHLGQALGVPGYYKQELFSEIIVFPPMPVALDFQVWLRASGLLFDLERNSDPERGSDPVPALRYADDWNEKYESLVERISIDGEDYLELSPAGQIFHETFRERFRSVRDQVLPPPALQKRPPRCDHGHVAGLKKLRRFLERITAEVPQVVHCGTFCHNPNLPDRTRFRLGSDGIEGIWSDGSECVKFRVETSATTPGQQDAVIAALNDWLTVAHGS